MPNCPHTSTLLTSGKCAACQEQRQLAQSELLSGTGPCMAADLRTGAVCILPSHNGYVSHWIGPRSLAEAYKCAERFHNPVRLAPVRYRRPWDVNEWTDPRDFRDWDPTNGSW